MIIVEFANRRRAGRHARDRGDSQGDQSQLLRLGVGLSAFRRSGLAAA